MTVIDPVAAVVPAGTPRTHSLPEALSIREDALAALGIALTSEVAEFVTASMSPAGQEDEGTTTNDQRPMTNDRRRQTPDARRQTPVTCRTKHQAPGADNGPESEDLLDAARQVLAAYRQQIAAHRAAVLVEDAWAITRHTPTASEREVEVANRRRRRARKAFRTDWETYLHRTERLCRVAERVLGLEGADSAGR